MSRTLVVASLFLLVAAGPSGSSQARPSPPPSPRLYVFDCGTLDIADPAVSD